MHPAHDRRRAFGDRLRVLRLEVGISQEELADRAGLHRTYVSSVERGQRNITLSNIHALADALGVDVRSLFADEDSSSSEPRPAD
jgi:transcriptional regulator with XRE-family HTH domain